jgi:hypothetical protein
MEPNFEKRISDVHSSHYHDFAKLFPDLKWSLDAENEWLTEEFAVATKQLKSNKSAGALRAVSRLNDYYFNYEPTR